MERDLHGGRRLVFNMMESGVRWFSSAEEGTIDERRKGKVKTASHIRPGIDEMDTR